MKKILKKLAALTAAVTVLSSAAAFSSITASASQYGQFYYQKNYKGEIEIHRCSTNDKLVYIPYKIEGKKISRIKKDTFTGCVRLRYAVMNGSGAVIEVGSVHPGTCYFCNTGNSQAWYDGETYFYGYNFGDYNADGVVDIVDAQLILKHYTTYTLAGKKNTSEFEYVRYLAIADIDRNGMIGIEDAQLVLEYYTESISGRPIGSLMDYMYNKGHGTI